MAARIPDEIWVDLATLKLSISNQNATGYTRDQSCHLKAEPYSPKLRKDGYLRIAVLKFNLNYGAIVSLVGRLALAKKSAIENVHC